MDPMRAEMLDAQREALTLVDAQGKRIRSRNAWHGYQMMQSTGWHNPAPEVQAAHILAGAMRQNAQAIEQLAAANQQQRDGGIGVVLAVCLAAVALLFLRVFLGVV